jgi:hypothetical protein
MLGHPGFSAMEYAGSTGGEERSSVKSEGVFRRRFGREAASPTLSKHEGEATHVADIQTTESDLLLQLVEEPTGYQRRRGTFMNHTPRNFEVPSPRRTETPQAYLDDSRHTSSSVHESIMRSRSCDPIERQRGSRKHMSSSSGGTGGLSKSAHSATTSRVASKAASAKGSAHYSPLEPLVAQHRREVTGSDVDTLPPYVDIENVSETSALFAVQEYFKSLELSGSATQVGEDGLTVQTGATPSLPDRNPERLNSPTRTRHAHAGSTLSDFTSAARGQYSPYGVPFNSPQIPRGFQDNHGLNDGQTTPEPERALTAPPIPSHEELTAHRPLYDLNYFLRNTGPCVKTPSEKKEKKGFVFGKNRNKKSLAAKFGSVEGSPAKEVQPPLPFRPTCAQEMTTSRGAKHLQIIIPATVPPSNPLLTLPVLDSQDITKRVSVSFTEKLLNPLASSGVENVVSGFNGKGDGHDTTEPSPASTRTVLRSPKRPAISPKAIPVTDHPLLMTRDEQTRHRKLRDLQQSKGKLFVPASEDTVAGAPPTPTESLEQTSVSPIENVLGGEKGRERGIMMEKITRLETLTSELAQELARAKGINQSKSALDPEDILRRARAHGLKIRR